jgi:hypothetical protein
MSSARFRMITAAAGFAMLVPSAAGAADFSVEGYADFRLIVPSNQLSWQDGGLGKLRFGAGDGKPDLQFTEAAADISVLITPGLIAVATARVANKGYTAVDLLEGYLRYRPVSTSRWRWSVKGGAFFPPVSLENTEVGWTSPWTLTPSAINSWIGEEIRIVGAEAMVEWRGDMRTLSLSGAVFGWNEPAGVLLADRGWSVSDAFTGLFGRPRDPDVVARQLGDPIPYRAAEFMQIDDRPGWYAAATWDEAGVAKLNAIAYDNRADPTAVSGDTIAWHTSFQDLGVSTQFGDVTLLAQGMLGQTAIRPSPFFSSDTHFSSAYLLAGWSINENWRLAGRADVFATSAHTPFVSSNTRESGNALTAAVDYLPTQWLRLTAEAIRVDSTRSQRNLLGIDPHAVENQFQLSARFYLP